MASQETKSEKLVISTPQVFSAIQGNNELKLLLLLLAIDPSIPGIIIFGNKGTGKSLFLNQFNQLNISKQNTTIKNYKKENNIDKHLKSKTNQELFHPILKMPPTTPIDAMVGYLDLSMKFRPGILSKANKGYLIIDDLHLMPSDALNILFNAWQSQQNIIQRSSISISHPSKFCLIASANSQNHVISSAFLDRFSFSYNLEYEDTVPQRLAVINSNLYTNNNFLPDKYPTNYDLDHLQENILVARKNLNLIKFPSKCLKFISNICIINKVDGYRADIALSLGARALASFNRRNFVSIEDILYLTPFVLNHRLNGKKQKLMFPPSHKNLDISKPFTSDHEKPSLKSPSNKEKLMPSPKIIDSPTRSKKFLQKFVAIFAIFIFSFLITLIIVAITSNQRIFLLLFTGIAMWSTATLLLILWVKKRRKLMEGSNLGTDAEIIKPDVSSFSNVKQLKITEATREAKKGFSKEIVLDLEEDQSRKGRILRFIGLQSRKGIITLSERQSYLIALIGVPILFLSLIFYTYLIFILPLEIWIYLFLGLLLLFTIGYVRQALQKERRIKRIADVGASRDETSASLGGEGIGSHIAPNNSSRTKISMEYEKNLIEKLTNLNLVSNSHKKDLGLQLMYYVDSKGSDTSLNKVIGGTLPDVHRRTDSVKRSKIGKRALSVTSLQSGRVIGSQPFKDYPMNIHLLATIRNAVIRNYRDRRSATDKGVKIKLEDIHEKKFCGRVSATIIFVLDLSESITNVIKTVSSSVNWLSRQAYLYRDRVGIVALKGVHGVVVQSPTSNLNLVKQKLGDLKVSGSTPLADGLQKAMDLIKLDRIRSKNETIPMIILITDGAANIPLLQDPVTGISRKTPLSELGINRAIKMAIDDCLTLCHQIKKKQISLTIFSTNIRGKGLLEELQHNSYQELRDFLESIMVESELFKGKDFIYLWSFTLLQIMREITKGHLFLLKKNSSLNTEILQIARAEILSSI